MMFDKVLIANRGEIACRIIRAAKSLGVQTVAVYSDADSHAMHVTMADDTYYIGPSDVSVSYLNQDKIIAIAKESGAEAIHPGYGLLSENAYFAKDCEEAGLIFIGPRSETIATLADKAQAKALAQSLNIPVIDSIEVPNDVTDEWVNQLELQGTYIIKACAGGGGKGMRLIEPGAKDIKITIELAKKEAKNYFDNDAIILERYVKPARHIEVQILADQHGKVIHLFDRDCSLQRRYQKVIEEAPAPDIQPEVRQAMYQAAISLAQSVNYVNAGTVEFLLDANQNFYFLEMNTRVQVEHCVTEVITHQDIVQRQFEIAAGVPIEEKQSDFKIDGSAIEVRLCAEMPEKNFMPSIGFIKKIKWPDRDDIRVDAGYQQGDVLTPYYDSMLAKIIVHGKGRREAVKHLKDAMNALYIDGIQTNRDWVSKIIHEDAFLNDPLPTHYLDQYASTNMSVFPHWLPLALMAIYQARYVPTELANNPWYQSSVSNQSKTIIAYQDNQPLAFSIQEKNPQAFVVLEQKQQCGKLRLDVVEKNKVLFEYDNIAYQANVFESADHYIIRLLGGCFHYEKYPQCEETSAEHCSGELTAPLPGSVVKVMFQQGDQVTKGDRLVVMEAMKMEHAVTAPFDGVIEKMHVAEGDRVSLGELLVVVG
jgi:3-methylcrotonyl-CoA carboxylase alpha subunit